MNLEELAKTLESGADVQNVTAIVLSFIVELGRRASVRPSATVGPSNLIPSGNGSNSSAINHEVDDTEILAHNITSILMRYYENNSELWEDIAINLEKGEILWKERANRRLSDLTYSIFITLYMLMISIRSFGNILVISAGIRQPSLITPRNAFILNQAVSDLLLCLFTMPLTFIELTNDHWQFGDSMMSCKLAGGLQAVSIFVSTISITVIALDRYQLIIYPTKDLLKRIGAAVALFFIWLLGFQLASPIFMVRTLEHHTLNSPNRNESGEPSPGGVHSIDYCYEKWPVTRGREKKTAIYSAFTLTIQCVLPILIISILHSKIFQRLRARHITLESIAVQESLKRIRETKRLRRRRHYLLMTVALVFSITWLPLNVLNFVLDVYNPFRHPDDEEKMLVIYAVCHLFGMSSACANPFLYGWFNDNFRNSAMNDNFRNR